jgi:site-specific DNA recombinase
MKAVGYFREAHAGAKAGNLASQNKAFLSFCEHEGYDVAATFVEPANGDDSNGNGKRSGFRQLVEYLRRREKGFVVVVTPSLDGLGDDLKEAARRFFQIEGLGARVTFMASQTDAAHQILSAWAARGETSVGERVRAAMRRKAVRGEVLGRPPYGYKVGSRRRLELVPEEAVVVRYIFRMYLHEGLGIRLIARRLNEEGLRTRRGGNWSMVSIRDVLRNRVYLGTYSRFGVRVPGSHPALVAPDDFRAVQDRLNERRNNYGKRNPSQFLLAGLAQCGHCGNRMIGVSRKQSWQKRDGDKREGSYRYYQCESRTNQSVCDYHTQRAADLEEQVREQLAGLSGPDAFVHITPESSVVAEWEGEAEQLRTRLRQMDRRLEDHLEAAAKSRISQEQLHKLGTAVAAERLSLEESLDETHERIRRQADASARKRERERALATLLDGWTELQFDQKRSLLRELVDRVVVLDDGIEVVLRP